MACYSPLKGYRGPGGKVTFKRTLALGTLGHVTVACGQCIGCKLERSRQWAVRSMHEAQLHEANCFLTLTYDDEHLPESGSLDLRHWQTFAKRTRKALGPFRFFHCGEYGDLTGRPHYHAAIFGLDFAADRRIYTESRGNKLYTSDILDKLWPHGYAVIGALTFQSAAYIARYCLKKITGSKAEQHYERVNETTGEVLVLKPEYTTMSRRPGIGSAWYAQFSSDVYPDDFVISNGQKARPPKFYDSQFELHDPEGLRLLKKRRRQAGSKHSKNNTPERLRVRETVQRSRLTQLKREI